MDLGGNVVARLEVEGSRIAGFGWSDDGNSIVSTTMKRKPYPGAKQAIASVRRIPYPPPVHGGWSQEVMATNLAGISRQPLALVVSDRLEKAVDIFCRKDFGQIPVTDQDGRLLGVVKRVDALKDGWTRGVTVGQVLRECDDAVSADTPMSKIQKMILREGRRRLYVCDENERLISVVTEGDLIKALSKQSQKCSLVLASALNSITEGVVVIDEDSTILFANAAHTRILGVPVESILHRRMDEVEPGAKILEVLKTGSDAIDEEVHIKTLGRRVVVNISPIRTEDNKIVGAVSVFRDVTETRRLLYRLQKAELMAEYLEGELGRFNNAFGDIVGESSAIKRALGLASRAAPTNATVLITGESGVGKDLVARAIHYSSARSGKPFVRVDCTSIPDTLLESELFGYEDGAFTGARKGGKPGKVELADEDTLFFDEIGEMNLGMQAKVLRLLQEREYERVGGTKTRKLDVRVVAATNKDLMSLVNAGRFREDLYYRLNVIPIRVPPLRERKEDIPSLTSHFTKQMVRLHHKSVRISQEAVDLLSRYHWPGNIRELRNVIEQCVVLADDGTEICPEHLPQYLRQGSGTGNGMPPEPDEAFAFPAGRGEESERSLGAHVRRAEREAIINALERCGGDRSKAMRLLGISRRTFYKKMRRCGLATGESPRPPKDSSERP
ncbi:MAG: sigma 54-interacting transcriptional regulator [Bacillota bacterium]